MLQDHHDTGYMWRAMDAISILHAYCISCLMWLRVLVSYVGLCFLLKVLALHVIC